MYTVYLATCRATGKVYVGCTGKGIQVRKTEHLVAAANGSPYKFHAAIRLHGSSSFIWTALWTGPSIRDAYQAERNMVARYNSYRDGLNSTPGGFGSPSDGARSGRKMPIRGHKSGKPGRLLVRAR